MLPGQLATILIGQFIIKVFDPILNNLPWFCTSEYIWTVELEKNVLDQAYKEEVTIKYSFDSQTYSTILNDI